MSPGDHAMDPGGVLALAAPGSRHRNEKGTAMFETGVRQFFLCYLWLRRRHGRERTMREFLASADVRTPRPRTPAPAPRRPAPVPESVSV
jgi:hypothetical protein